MDDQPKPLWNSLEITKIVVSTLTPVTLAIFGFYFAHQSEARRDDMQKYSIYASEKSSRDSQVVEKRVDLWDELGPRLNDIYAFSLYVGNWQNMSAADIIRIKRECDRIFYAYRPFFSPEFISAYGLFMEAAFQTYNLIGEDAKIRSPADHRRVAEPLRFSGEDNRQQIHQTYFALLEVVARELRLNQSGRPAMPTQRRN